MDVTAGVCRILYVTPPSSVHAYYLLGIHASLYYLYASGGGKIRVTDGIFFLFVFVLLRIEYLVWIYKEK